MPGRREHEAVSAKKAERKEVKEARVFVTQDEKGTEEFSTGRVGTGWSIQP
jgi:hypothetical protein